jgi:GTP cyclohydrolase II
MLEDDMAYPLQDIRVHPDILEESETFYTRSHSFEAVQGDPETQGAAFMNVVGNVAEFEDSELGPLVRLHSTCGNSELGRLATLLMYSDPEWLHQPVEDKAFSPAYANPHWLSKYSKSKGSSLAFVEYGDGLVMGYPPLDDANLSEDCDCRAQRRLAHYVISAVGGINVSLSGDAHEARGHGIFTKHQIYEMQALGFDTVDACRLLGLEEDIRDYGHVVQRFKDMGLTKIALMTNNPRKIAAFEQEDIKVTPVALIPAWITDEAWKYVRTKAKRLGHSIDHRTEFVFDFEKNEFRLQDIVPFINNPYVPSTDIRLVKVSRMTEGLYREWFPRAVS